MTANFRSKAWSVFAEAFSTLKPVEVVLTPQDKLDDFKEKNPVLTELIDKFDLKIA